MAKQPSATDVLLQGKMSAVQPGDLSTTDASRIIKVLASDTRNILVVDHAKARQRQRRITRPQIERCV